MNFDTKTGKLKLLKRERDILEGAYGLCGAIVKHGSGDLQQLAKIAENGLKALATELHKVSPVEAPAEPEPKPAGVVQAAQSSKTSVDLFEGQEANAPNF